MPTPSRRRVAKYLKRGGAALAALASLAGIYQAFFQGQDPGQTSGSPAVLAPENADPGVARQASREQSPTAPAGMALDTEAASPGTTTRRAGERQPVRKALPANLNDSAEPARTPPKPASAPTAPAPVKEEKPRSLRTTGQGFAPQSAPPERRYYLARRAAELDARRRLLEIVVGAQTKTSSSSELGELKEDAVSQEAAGLVRGARVVAERETPGGGVEVTMELPLEDMSSGSVE